MKPIYDKPAIARRLIATRSALGYGADQQMRFALDAGLSQNAYNQYEQCVNRISLDAAHKLCDTYHITLDWIYRGDPSGLRQGLYKKLLAMGAIGPESEDETVDEDEAPKPMPPGSGKANGKRKAV